MVTVKGYVDRVVPLRKGGRRDARTQLPKQTLVLDRSTLATLGPAGADYDAVFRDWALPACFTDFPRAGNPRRWPAHDGTCGYALLGEHPLTVRAQSIDACTSEHLTAQAVIQRTRSFATIEATTRTASPPELECPARLRSRCRSPT